MADTHALQEVSAGLAALVPSLVRALERRIDLDYPHPKPPETQLSLMRLVRERDGVTVRDAAASLLMKPNNVSSLVSHLVAEGLLTRVQDETDKRVAHLHVTELARTRLSEVDALMTGYALESLGNLPDAEIDAIHAALPALVHLTEQLRGAAP